MALLWSMVLKLHQAFGLRQALMEEAIGGMGGHPASRFRGMGIDS
jgi:hypothetical protein